VADFDRKLTMLAERGIRVGPEEMIERVEAHLAEDPLVVVNKQRKGWGMSIDTDDKQERKQRGGTSRGLAWAAAVFVVVVGIAVMFIAFGGEPESDAVEPGPNTTVVTETTSVDDTSNHDAMVDLVQSGIDAYYAGDYDSAAESLDFASIESSRSEQDWRDQVAYFSLVNAEGSVDCEPSVGNSLSASCAITYSDDLVRAIYGDALEASDEYSTVTVADGKIKSIELVGPDSTMWSLGIYLAERGRLAGFKDCMRGTLTPECAQILQRNLSGYEKWHSQFDATELVSTGMKAWFEGDCALAMTMFGGRIADQLADCLAGTLPDVMAYEREIGANVEVTECDFVAADEMASCTVTYSNALNRAVGAPPSEMTIDLLVTPVEKALWYYQREFYRSGDTYPHDEALDESFQSYADEKGFGLEHRSACRAAASDASCAQLRLDNLDDWAAWHLANN
jgi:hypothetical protein